jgi:hypothetical protein
VLNPLVPMAAVERGNARRRASIVMPTGIGNDQTSVRLPVTVSDKQTRQEEYCSLLARTFRAARTFLCGSHLTKSGLNARAKTTCRPGIGLGV